MKAVNIEWNRYEVALLVEAFQNCKAGFITRKEAVTCLSNRLREGTTKLGIRISDTFRNENGIGLQWNAIQTAFGEDVSIGKPSKLFCEVAKLYNQDKSSFSKILAVANVMYPPIEHTGGVKYSYVQASLSQDLTLSPNACEKSQTRYINTKIKAVVEKKFPNGYRLSSAIETKRFRQFYKEMYGYDLDKDMADIDEDVKACGVVHETRVYLPELMLTEDVKNSLIDYITNTFNSGQQFVYYSVLFNKFRDAFLDNKVYDENMLREYLEAINSYDWYFKPLYLSNTICGEVDVQQEVIQFIKECGLCVTEDAIISKLSHLPKDAVRRVLQSRALGLINCGKKTYFHIDNFNLSNEELECIRKIIKSAIDKHGYVGFEEVCKDIKNLQPQIIENNEVFTITGLYKVIVYKLSREFLFSSNVISRYNNPYTTSDCFAYSSNKDEYTLSEVNRIAEDCGASLNNYFEILLQNSCRINAEKFVANRFIHFDVDAIDSALMKLCKNDYIAINDVEMVFALPSCEYPWNLFLLESFVFRHSKLFKHIKAGSFSLKKAVGVIVKRSANIHTFIDLAARNVVDCGVDCDENKVLEFLFNKGYIAQRHHRDIKKIITAAQLLTKTRS